MLLKKKAKYSLHSIAIVSLEFLQGIAYLHVPPDIVKVRSTYVPTQCVRPPWLDRREDPPGAKAAFAGRFDGLVLLPLSLFLSEESTIEEIPKSYPIWP